MNHDVEPGFHRPYVLVFSTATIDGRIASSTGFSSLSCSYDLARLRLLRGMSDAVMVGANTVRVDNPRLQRRVRPRSSRFYRVVVDGRLTLSPDFRVFGEGPPTILFTAVKDDRIKEFERRGVVVYVVGANGSVDLARALMLLYEEHGIERLLVEGGGVLTYSLLASRLVDEVRVTYTPFVFAAGRSFVEDPRGVGFPDTGKSPKLRLICAEICPCGNCVHAAFKVLDVTGHPVVEGFGEACLSGELRSLSDLEEA
ncbi:MAG: dihydrofolate reductase family protein [Thermoproteota archaeon]